MVCLIDESDIKQMEKRFTEEAKKKLPLALEKFPRSWSLVAQNLLGNRVTTGKSFQ